MSVSCRVVVEAAVSASEDPQKVLQAVLNVVSCEASLDDSRLRAVSGIESLGDLRHAVLSKRAQGGLRRNLLRHADGRRTWFYLNRQAAFAGTAVVCDSADESPLGPIRITLESAQLDYVIQWLAGP